MVLKNGKRQVRALAKFRHLGMNLSKV